MKTDAAPSTLLGHRNYSHRIPGLDGPRKCFMDKPGDSPKVNIKSFCQRLHGLFTESNIPLCFAAQAFGRVLNDAEPLRWLRRRHVEHLYTRQQGRRNVLDAVCA